MYIWFGIDVNEQLLPLREAIARAEEIVPPDHSGLTLPLHISLKISFYAPAHQVEAIKARVLDYYKGLTPFLVETASIQKEDGIIWLRYQPHATLERVQSTLNQFLLEEFGIPLHPYDLDFKFHTTLYMDSNPEKLDKASELLLSQPYPAHVLANRFCIGVSDDGSLGTYSVVETVTHELS
jgi:2'-5' RNA ligase